MRKAKREYYKNRIGNLNNNPKQGWKTVNDILGRGRGEWKTNFERYINKVDITSFAFQTISYPKVFKLLDKLIVSKATGINKIPARILKVAAPVITNSITKILNCSIESGKFPLD